MRRIVSFFKWLGISLFVFLAVVSFLDELTKEDMVRVSLKDSTFATPELQREIRDYLEADRIIREPEKIEVIRETIARYKRDRVDFLGVGDGEYLDRHFSDSKCVLEVKEDDVSWEVCRSPGVGWYLARYRPIAYHKYDRGYTFYRLSEKQAKKLIIELRRTALGD